MPKYVLTFHGEMGDMPSDEAGMAEVMAVWGAWYGTMGASLVDGGAPFAAHWGVGSGGDVDAPKSDITGYTIIDVADVAAAKAIAAGCPVLAHGNTVQISESMNMGG